jgi:hypothetical protein
MPLNGGGEAHEIAICTAKRLRAEELRHNNQWDCIGLHHLWIPPPKIDALSEMRVSCGWGRRFGNVMAAFAFGINTSLT